MPGSRIAATKRFVDRISAQDHGAWLLDGGSSVKGHEEEWQILCKQAAVEQDPAKLLNLVERINQLLEAKGQRLQGPNDKSREATHGNAG